VRRRFASVQPTGRRQRSSDPEIALLEVRQELGAESQGKQAIAARNVTDPSKAWK
jgi:hypothetical protein